MIESVVLSTAGISQDGIRSGIVLDLTMSELVLAAILFLLYGKIEISSIAKVSILKSGAHVFYK